MTDDEALSLSEKVAAVTKSLADQGKLIEAGWTAMQMVAIHPDADPNLVRQLREAFFAGAQHIFASLLAVLDDDQIEPTEMDFKRIDLINKELNEFIQDFERRHSINVTGGQNAQGRSDPTKAN